MVDGETEHGSTRQPASDTLCPWCGAPQHPGVYDCPRIAAVELYEDGTLKRVELVQAAGAPSAPESDAAFRRRVLMACGAGSVWFEKAKTAVGAELDGIGAFYELKRHGT